MERRTCTRKARVPLFLDGIPRYVSSRNDYNDRAFGGSTELGTTAVRATLIEFSLRYKSDIHKGWNEDKPMPAFQDIISFAGLEDTVTLSETMCVIAGASCSVADTADAEHLDSENQRIALEKESTAGFNPQIGCFYSLLDSLDEGVNYTCRRVAGRHGLYGSQREAHVGAPGRLHRRNRGRESFQQGLRPG